MPERFFDRLSQAQDMVGSDIMLWMAPRLNRLPGVIQRYDDPFLPFGRAVIDATRDLVCGYIFDLASYLSLGAASAVALERTVAYVDNHLVRILHGPFSGPDYVAAAFDSNFAFDAVTLISEGDWPAYQRPLQTAFVIRDEIEHDSHGVRYNTYWRIPNRLLAIDGERTMTVRVAGEDVLYAAQTVDFAEQIRTRLQAMHNA